MASFATKYHYKYWRPTSAIHEAQSDDNPLTSADPTWTPLQPAPPIPEYESAHSVQGGAHGISRIYVGFHFRNAVEEGIAHGRRIGDRAVDGFLRLLP